MRELLEELLRCYRNYHVASSWGELTGEEERQKTRNLAMKAWETLRSLFPVQKELDEDYLSQEGGADIERTILEEMEKWAVSGLIHRPGGQDATNYSTVASHLDDYKARLDQLTDSPGDTPALWPFIKLIRSVLSVS